MNRFKILNNATTLINEDFIIDPWIYGNLYNNSWSPFPDINYDKNKLLKIKYCYISHLHQDHWDIDTIKYFNKDTIFYISNMKFNLVIKKTLNHMGFKNVVSLEYKKNYNISKKYNISVVPPLNRYAHETNDVEDKDDNAIAIDTGILVKTKNDGLNHLILSDNSPYDYSIFKKNFKKKKISTLFFPYNGFADDYPLCYDDLNLAEKKKISLNRSLTREKYLINFIAQINPKYVLPYSSEFSLNTHKKIEFKKIHPKFFRDKELYSERIEKITKIKSFAVFSEDALYLDKKNFFFEKNSTNKSRNKIKKNIKLKFPKSNKKINFDDLIEKSLTCYLERIKKYQLNFKKISKWKLIINITDKKKIFIINIKENKIEKKTGGVIRGRYLMLKTNLNIIKCILEKKLHMNNCQIGCYLSWKRSPNIFSKELNDSLNFFHI